MRAFITEHRIALLLMMLVGAMTGSASVLAPLSIGSAYQGIPFFPLSDEYHYLANIHEVLDGYWNASSVFIYEYKNMPTSMFPVNEWFYAVPAALFGLVPVAVASKFLLPALLFFLTYMLVYKVLDRETVSGRLTALACALFVTLGAEFVNYAYIFSLLKVGGPPVVSLWTRLVNPISGALQLMAFLLALWSVWERRWRFAHLAAGVLIAMMVGYYFAFGLALAILGALFAVALARKESDVAKKLFAAGALSVVIDAPWWYATLTAVSGEAGRWAATRSGMFFTHAPVLNKALLTATVLLLALYLYARYYRGDRSAVRTWLFAGSLLAGSWLAFNQQILTGREIWYQHFVQYTVPMCVIALFIGAHLALSHLRAWWKAGLLALSAITLAYGFFLFTAYRSEADIRYFTRLQVYAPLFDWLNAHAAPECVVLVNPSNEMWQSEEGLIPGFSRCNTYMVWDSLLAKTPERGLHDFLLRLQMLGVRPSGAREYLLAHWGDVRGSFYEDWGQAFGRGVDAWVEAKVDELVPAYAAFAKQDIETNIRTYKIDYLLSEGPLGQGLRAALPALTLATTTGEYYLYAFPNPR